MKDKFFCDSNIFLYAFGDIDEDKKKISSNLITNNCTISTQVINEVSNNIIKKLKFNNHQVQRFVISCYRKYEIINFDENIFLSASEIRDTYNISYYDSLIVASAISSNSTILYSEDMHHNQKINNILIVNPFKEEI